MTICSRTKSCRPTGGLVSFGRVAGPTDTDLNSLYYSRPFYSFIWAAWSAVIPTVKHACRKTTSKDVFAARAATPSVCLDGNPKLAISIEHTDVAGVLVQRRGTL